jgi:hypothetical protein
MIHQTQLMGVQDTSRESYRAIVSHPYELTGRYLEYLESLKGVGHPATDMEVSRFAGHSDPNYFRMLPQILRLMRL